MVLRLPQEKLRELRTLLAQWCTWRYCRTRDLQSLVGKLQHACKVVRPGRTFLRRMFKLLKGTRRHQQFIRLNAAFRSDLTWWHSFLEHWNGMSMLDGSLNKPPNHHLFTDASGWLGCGAWAGRYWFQYFWPEEIADRSIAVKELLPIVLACIVWVDTWSHQSVLAHCDKQSVVAVVNTGYSRDTQLMHLLRSLFFITAHHEITLRAAHIPGVDNVAADAISRDNLILFHSQVPAARPSPTRLPPAALSLLVPQQPRLDIPGLDSVVQELLTSGLALSTHRVYQSGRNRYMCFCEAARVTPYPATEDTLLLFIAHLHGTIKSYLAAIRFDQIGRGLGSPCIQCQGWNMCSKGQKRPHRRAPGDASPSLLPY